VPIIYWLADDFLNHVINTRSSFEAPLKEHKDDSDARTLALPFLEWFDPASKAPPGSSNR
jgi:hypothetical protein